MVVGDTSGTPAGHEEEEPQAQETLVAVLEDGATFVPAWHTKLSKVLPLAGDSWDIIQLQSSPAEAALPGCTSEAAVAAALCAESRRRSVGRRCLLPVGGSPSGAAPGEACARGSSGALLLRPGRAGRVLAALRRAAGAASSGGEGGRGSSGFDEAAIARTSSSSSALLDHLLELAARRGFLEVLAVRPDLARVGRGRADADAGHSGSEGG